MNLTANHTPPRPWLAGVCAWLAWKLNWNVLGVRAGAVLFLMLMPLATAVAYIGGALLLGLDCGRSGERQRKDAPRSMDRRMEEFDRKMEEFDRELERRTGAS